MTDEELEEGFKDIICNARDDLAYKLVNLVKTKVESEKLFDEKVLERTIAHSDIINRVIREHIEKWVATEVGNRLRCRIYDGIKVNQLFDSIWTEQLDIAIKDRIRSKVYTAIDTIITEKLNSLKNK